MTYTILPPTLVMKDYMMTCPTSNDVKPQSLMSLPTVMKDDMMLHLIDDIFLHYLEDMMTLMVTC